MTAHFPPNASPSGYPTAPGTPSRFPQTPPPPADVPIETAQYDDNAPISEDDISSEVFSGVDEEEEEEEEEEDEEE